MNLRLLPTDLFLRSGGPLSRLLLPATVDKQSHELRNLQLAGCTNLFSPGKIIFKDSRSIELKPNELKPNELKPNELKPNELSLTCQKPLLGCCVLAAPTVETEEDQTKLLRWLDLVQGENEVIYLEEEYQPMAPEVDSSERVDSLEESEKKPKVIYLEEDDPHIDSKLAIISQITTANTTYETRKLFGAKRAMEKFHKEFHNARKGFSFGEDSEKLKYVCLCYQVPEIRRRKYTLFSYDTSSHEFRTIYQGIMAGGLGTELRENNSTMWDQYVKDELEMIYSKWSLEEGGPQLVVS